MKILMVSIPTLHFFRWVDQFKHSGIEVYWFDITGMSTQVAKIEWVKQKVNWKQKIKYPGRTKVKQHLPKIYNFIDRFNTNYVSDIFEKYLNEVKPDVVHSFALYLSCTPILSVMKKHHQVKWIYSSWGSDLFYFKNIDKYLVDIKHVLPRVNYMFSDCKRDYNLAKSFGFSGEYLGCFPGGGGFSLPNSSLKKTEERQSILIKGFQGRSGRAIPVLQAIIKLKDKLKYYDITVFGADAELFDYLKESEIADWDNFSVQGKISHQQVLKLMGNAMIYIGNSNSDGMPNTMLESIIMGAFPIQSNPGGATEEFVINYKNGLLIQDCNSVVEISKHITYVLEHLDILNKAFVYNQEQLRPQLERADIAEKVLKIYKKTCLLCL
ncbi:glycosyltransferase [Algibacter miyuki]|uniref:Glycosyltransferase n=1 Tax=Algibacter miyuki TaxID=1306933 RepID=A0ABV5H2E9_9FLAO|nr:glycosyltransferase [Algibacter miyuki]MDN3666491.1 glycosyltransferase [Algibacter miyuki]